MLRDTLKTLLAAYGPSGKENTVAETIKNLISAHVETMRTDALGNLIVEKLGSDENGKRIMFSAHMDHIGFVVTHIEDNGYLRVNNVGGINPQISNARHVIFENGTEGVLYCQPLKGETMMMKHLFIDIGAEDREEAEKSVQLGDMAVYAPDCFELGEHRIASPAMDDRCACALLIQVLKNLGETKDTVIAVFSVQEEVGCRGAKVAAFSQEPDIGIAIDVTAWGDTPETKLPAIKLGEGIAVKVMDRASISNPMLREELIACGEKAGVKVQREVLPFGGTDAGAMQTARGGIPVCTISIPCRYIHSACEVIDMRDMDAGLKLLLNYLS